MELHGPELLIRRGMNSLTQLQRDPHGYIKNKVLPIFVLSRDRPKTAQLNFASAHALGAAAARDAVVIIVIPEAELEIDREVWPQNLFLTLPSVSSRTGAGYARWAIQLCTSWGTIVPHSDRSRGISFGIPCYYTFDDLVSCFYANKDLPDKDIAAANMHNKSRSCIVRKSREARDNAFKHALLACQRHPEAPTCALAGFLRDDATCTTKVSSFTLNSCSLYKVVLVNNAVLNDLHVPRPQTASRPFDFVTSPSPIISHR